VHRAGIKFRHALRSRGKTLAPAERGRDERRGRDEKATCGVPGNLDVTVTYTMRGDQRPLNAIQVRELPSDEPAGKPAVITVR